MSVKFPMAERTGGVPKPSLFVLIFSPHNWRVGTIFQRLLRRIYIYNSRYKCLLAWAHNLAPLETFKIVIKLDWRSGLDLRPSYNHTFQFPFITPRLKVFSLFTGKSPLSVTGVSVAIKTIIISDQCILSSAKII